MISDGFARLPFMRAGITWIPQQFWAPAAKSKGLWTICIHSNTAPDSFVGQLRVFLSHHARQFTSVDRVLSEFKPEDLSLTERAYEAFALRRFQLSRLKKKRQTHLTPSAN